MEYNKKVLSHFKNPRNMGEIKNPDAIARVGNPKCGDVMEIQIKISLNKNNQKFIKDIKFKTFGCVAAIATSSMITELAKGKTLEQAKKITMNDVFKSLKGLPNEKIHCSALADQALRKAIENYEKNN